jgi:phenylacetate-CoA ligase
VARGHFKQQLTMAHFLEKFYPYVPVPVQNLGISIYGLAWRRERLGGNFSHHVNGFVQREHWTPDQMRHHVTNELRRILLRGFDHVPYYAAAWKEAGLSREDLERMTADDLHRLPITPKQALRECPDAFVAQDVPRKLQHRYSSSGSTGTPITAICTAEDHRRFYAAREARSFGWAGCSVHEGRSMIGGRMVVPRATSKGPFYRYNAAERQVYFSAYHISPQNAADYVEGFNRYKPQLLAGYANSYFLLARMMLEQGLRLDYQPKAIVLGSEKLTLEMKNILQAAFHARAFEEYGAVENCVLATECEHGHLHISPDYGVLEIVDDNAQAVAPGVEGKILTTGLLNETQLLIRYEIGDVGVWSANTCPCGRDSMPVLQEIVGRLEDVVVGPDGRELVRFHGIFIDLPHVLEGQVIQETMDRFTVKVVGKPGFGEVDERLIRSRFGQRLGEVEVNILQVPEIPRTERGKFRAVISNVKRQTIRAQKPITSDVH